jgi:hypothetical protein
VFSIQNDLPHRINDDRGIRSPCLLTEGKTVKFEVIFDEKLSEQRSLHEVNEQRREIFHQKAPKISG